MIAEDYVSYEVAKLLKEKGFAEPCQAYWRIFENGDRVHTTFAPNENHNNAKGFISMPTHQMTMKWLREKGIDISITPEFSTEAEPRVDFFCGYSATVFTTEEGEYIDECIIKKEEEWGYAPFDCYEETVEAALKYCLTELI